MWVSDNVKRDFENRLQNMLRNIMNTHIEFISIGVFGSYARDEYKATSDIDICVIVKGLPPREIKGWLYEDADILNIDLIFVTEDYFQNDNSRFASNLRRDFKEVSLID